MANKVKPLTVQKIRNFLRLLRKGKKQAALKATMQVHRSPQQEWLKRGLVLAACLLGHGVFAQNAVNPLLYEVNLRQHTPEGTIAAFQPQLDRMTALGVDMIWLMPVQPIGERKRKAKGDLFVEDIADTSLHKQYLGSPYSIRDYKAVNPDFGTLEEFRALVQACHERKIRVILDWVGNHTAWDHPWISAHPDWYTKNANGGITDPLNEQGQSMGWTDVADLDYSNRAMRKEMIAAMRFWLDSTGIDGFRCDVAMSVPADFWEEARQAFSDYKDLFMLAESEEHDMAQFWGTKAMASGAERAKGANGPFNAYYSWELHHLLNQIAKGKEKASAIGPMVDRKLLRFPAGVQPMNFITNHDENSWNGTEFERMGEAWEPLAVLTYTLPGIPLLYTGQEFGNNRRLRFFEKDTVQPQQNFPYTEFYAGLGRIHSLYPALHAAKGAYFMRWEKTGNENVIAYTRSAPRGASQPEDTKVWVIINLSEHPQRIKAKQPAGAVLMHKGAVKGKKMEPWSYRVIAVQ